MLIQVGFKFNRMPTQLQPALQWLGLQFTGFPPRSSTPPTRLSRLIFDSKIPPPHKIQQRRVRTAQPNVDSISFSPSSNL
ncbi:hypothetical protein C8F04DRAFT_1391926 [Mycena alexandri]|uniref:Uncharacterized protein n=1 Tax=Mycena alexandri TaxID=1745969 RepID=A0AAD6T627_9AGAR|nr:hypothetical protein C8F04DRAFT_1391926 [Mycena alexandri]